MKNRQWLLARRPQGMITEQDFTWTESEAPVPGEGEVLVRNLLLSCDPTQRGWISADTYLPAVKIGEVVRSVAAGRVEQSNHPKYPVGAMVQGLFGWQDYAIAKPGTGSAPGPVPQGVPLETAMSVLGMTGITAWFGLHDIGRPKAGETVVVSGAAGATGSVVGQLAKIHGCRAVGIAGGPEKCRYLTEELGFDAAIDYKAGDVTKALKDACPTGIDVYFDNVGGELLDAALARIALRGRVVLCGGIARYNDTGLAPGPKNYMNLVVRRGRMEAFIVLDYMSRAAEAIAPMMRFLAEGRLKDRVDVQRGLENAPATLARLFKGENFGKQLLRIAE